MRRDSRAQAAFDRGMAAAAAADWPGAIRGLQEASQWAPGDAEIWYNLMCARIRLPDLDGAIEAGQRAEKIDPATPHLQLFLGNAYTQRNQFPYAVAAYLKALQTEPQQLAIHVNLGSALEQLGLFEEAYECYETALILGGERSAILSAMHYIAQHAGRWDWSLDCELRLKWEMEHGKNAGQPFQLLTVPGMTRAQQREAAENYAKLHFGR